MCGITKEHDHIIHHAGTLKIIYFFLQRDYAMFFRNRMTRMKDFLRKRKTILEFSHANQVNDSYKSKIN